MSSQNMISAELRAEVKKRILDALDGIRTQLDFTRELTSSQIHRILKAGPGYAPFIDRAYRVAMDYPAALPQVFDLEEYRRDYALAKDLEEIQIRLSDLAKIVGDTLTAVQSDTLVESLDVYKAVKDSKDKLPGLIASAAALGEFFKKAAPKKAAKSA